MSNQKKILIIGAGVSGLTTAFCLAKQQYKVTVIAKEFSPNITSNVAGALWEWPPAVCGYHSDEVSLERSKDWCMQSYEIFYELVSL
jgi:D-amino-acid oxidase